jgi:hypothetical protein
MAIFNEHRSEHNVFVFLTSCKLSKEMLVTKIGVNKKAELTVG